MASKESVAPRKTADELDRFNMMECTKLDKDNARRERKRGTRRANTERRRMLLEEKWNRQHAETPGPSTLPNVPDDLPESARTPLSEEGPADAEDAVAVDDTNSDEGSWTVHDSIAMVEETSLNAFMSSTTETLRIMTRQLGMIANSVDELVTGMRASFNGLREEVRAALASTWNNDLQSTSDPPEALARPFSHSFLPVKTESDLRNLEVAAASGGAFVTDAKEHFLSKYPYEKYQGNGRTVLLRLIDDFFSRLFISGCLWTGFSVTGERKIAFRKYRETLRLLSILVQQSDPAYSYERCVFDLKNLLQRASKRSTRVLRVPSARPNFKPKKGKENMDNASVT